MVIFLNRIRPVMFGFLIIAALVFATSTANAATSQGPYVYVTNSYYNDNLNLIFGNTVSVIDTKTNNVIATIPVGKSPNILAANPDGTKLYVSCFESISVINIATNTVIATIPAYYSTGIAVNHDGTKLYMTNHNNNTLEIINTTTNSVTSTIKLEGLPHNIVMISPDGTKLYLMLCPLDQNLQNNNFNLTICVIDTVTNKIIANIPFDVTTDNSNARFTLSPDGTKLYVVSGWGNFSVINTTTNTVTSNLHIDASGWYLGIKASPDGTKLYVLDNNIRDNHGNVLVMNSTTLAVTAKIPMVGPFGIAVSPDGTKIYTCTYGVSVIDAETNNVAATIPANPAGYSQHDIIIVPDHISPVMPVANFTANQTSGVAPLGVLFTDNSSGYASQREWDFGDGTAISTNSSPTHVFQNAGIYNVTLKVTNGNGTSTLKKNNYIVVNTSPSPTPEPTPEQTPFAGIEGVGAIILGAALCMLAGSKRN